MLYVIRRIPTWFTAPYYMFVMYSNQISGYIHRFSGDQNHLHIANNNTRSESNRWNRMHNAVLMLYATHALLRVYLSIMRPSVQRMPTQQMSVVLRSCGHRTATIIRRESGANVDRNQENDLIGWMIQTPYEQFQTLAKYIIYTCYIRNDTVETSTSTLQHHHGILISPHMRTHTENKTT